MDKLRVAIVDLVTKAPTRSVYGRLMHANLASIMPQALGAWCEQEGHEVTYVCYTGFEDLVSEVPEDADVLFVGGFTQSAFLAYALSALARRRGAITVLGGPHARCYPDDAARHFDYVLGFTDRELVQRVLEERRPGRPRGRQLSAPRQPATLPGVRERWKFIRATMAKVPVGPRWVPMIGSLGCPYTCEFCIDSQVAYQPLAFDRLREDLRFLAEQMPRAYVGWHDPNFGVRFDEYMRVIEEAAPPGRISYAAESSLSLLSEQHVRRLSRAGFVAMLPGIESWYSLGGKSGTGRRQAMAKVEQVSGHVNMILRHIPYVQANFVLGLDCDAGPEPFELTKRFLDLTPGMFPGYSLLTAFGEAAPLNLELQRQGRVLPFPFRFLNNNKAMNVRPLHYGWVEFYDHVIDLTAYSFSPRSVRRRFAGTRSGWARSLNLVRALSSEGRGRLNFYRRLRQMLVTDREIRAFFEGETERIPAFYEETVRRDLGPLWELLPPGTLYHDPNAYLKKVSGGAHAIEPPAAVAAAAAASAAGAGAAATAVAQAGTATVD